MIHLKYTQWAFYKFRFESVPLHYNVDAIVLGLRRGQRPGSHSERRTRWTDLAPLTLTGFSELSRKPISFQLLAPYVTAVPLFGGEIQWLRF